MWQPGVYLAPSAGRVLLRAVATVFLPNLTWAEEFIIYLKTSTQPAGGDIFFNFWVSVKPLCQIYSWSRTHQWCQPTLPNQPWPPRCVNSLKFIGKISGGSKTCPAGSFKLGRARECYRSQQVIMLVKPYNGCLSVLSTRLGKFKHSTPPPDQANAS